MTRIDLPSPGTLGLSRPTAAQDLKDLGWDTEATLPLVWCIAAMRRSRPGTQHHGAHI